jgi:hypothetical protein
MYEDYDVFFINPSSKLWLSLSRFASQWRLYQKFNENQTNGVIADVRSQTEKEGDGKIDKRTWSSHNALCCTFKGYKMESADILQEWEWNNWKKISFSKQGYW